MADKNKTGLKAIIAAMESISNIQQEQNKLKMNLIENSQKYRDNFLNTLYKQKAEMEGKKAMIPLETEAAVQKEKALLPYKIEEERRKKSMVSPEEARKLKEQELRDFRYDINTMYQRGGTVDEDRVKEINQQLNMDILPELEAGRGEPSVGPGGKRQWRVLSDNEWATKVNQGVFSEAEKKNIDNLVEERRAWKAVKRDLDSLGINENTIGTIEWTNVMSPMGPLSLPSKFHLAGQIAQDPKYTAIKNKIEQAFQLYRIRVTGAQAGMQELRSLRGIVPSLRNRPEVFFQSVNDLIKDTEESYNNKIDLYSRWGRDTSKLKNLMEEEPAGIPSTNKVGKYTYE